ncbi:hypothetical protein C6P46_002933 [Rhodotorula mucilaginosa]|uniref:Uncharacterized protein n=1 Tax=Rhodotorula mucilaginosa TaxID=5537 RepID=A0A9P6W412_RHOMI|nr:hypothetical protein C6P46_002933 [Rhodotorula mucilaginosa]TKA53315.1 hypothetical protein B0A53_04333 [Rhodotorula sp. CCFEE 5036]
MAARVKSPASTRKLAQLLVWALATCGSRGVLAQSASTASTSSRVVSSIGTATATARPAPEAPSLKTTTVQLPPLYACEYSTWTYTAPVGPKYLGFYVSGTTSWIETYSLPAVYDDRTNGSFTWKCDLPAGLSVAAMFYVIPEGATDTQGAQASTPDAVINAGASGTSCLGTNDPGSQAKILSLASSLDPGFSATSSPSQPSGGAGAQSGGDGGNNTGAIVGGVVGGVLGVAALGALLIYLKRKHDNAAWTAGDGLSVYSGRSEKVGSSHMSQMGRSVAPSAMGGLAPPPPGTYYATDDTGNLHLVMGYASQESESLPPVPPSVGAESTLASPLGRPTAPPGTLPEPMDDRDEAQTVPSPVLPGGSPFSDRAASSARFDQAGTNARDPHRGHAAFQPISEREGVLGAQGLEDPSSFSSQRLAHHEV